MMDFTVVVYGNGDLYRECFNAIAALVGNDTYQSFLKITTLFAFAIVFFAFALNQKIMFVFRWLFLFYIVYFILFIPKVTINIEDNGSKGSALSVDNVPLGLAVMASYTSLIGDALTKILEATFSLPDDLRYQKSGMVMASRLVTSANKFEITDSEFNSQMLEFTHRCVFYDLLMHRYSIDNLLRSENTWEFIKKNTSKANAFALNGSIISCREGASTLGTRWNEIINQVSREYGTRLFTKSTEPGTDLKTRMVSSYRFLLNDASANAEVIFSQHLIKNVIDRGIIRMDGTLDASAALQTYSITRANDQLIANFVSMGELVGDWIVNFKNAIEIIAYAMFIFVILLAVFPGGNKVLKNYLLLLFWLQLWAPLYAIINLIISFYARSNVAGFSSLTLHSISAVLDSNKDMAAVAGYFTLLVPFLSWKILSGMSALGDHFAHGLMGSLQSSVAIGASEATSGNFSFGNTNFANHSSDNNNQFKWDTSGRFSSGILQSQLSDGSIITNTPKGRTIADVASTISKLGTEIDLTGSIRESFSNQADNSIQNAFNQSKESAKNFMSSSRDLYQFDKLLSKGEGSTISWSESSNANATEAYRDVMQKTQKFADDHRISFGDAARVLSSAHADIKLGAQLGVNVPLTTTGFSVGGAMSRSRGSDVTSHHDQSTLFDKAKNYIKDSGYSENLDTVERSIKDESLRTSNEKANRLLESSSKLYDSGESYRSNAQNSLQQAESFRESASNAEEIASSYRMNITQQLAEHISKQPHPSGDGPITFERMGDVMNDPQLMKRYVDDLVAKNVNQFHLPKNSNLPHSKHDIEHEFVMNNNKLDYKESLKSTYETDKSQFKNEAHSKMGSVDVNYNLKNIVEDKIATDKEKISNHQNELAHVGQNFEKQYEEEANRKRSSKHPVANMIKGIDTKNYDE